MLVAPDAIRHIKLSSTVLELSLMALRMTEPGLPTGIVWKRTDMFTFGLM